MIPTPRTLYVHDDLTELVRDAGDREADMLAAALLHRLVTEPRVVLLTLEAQIAALLAHGSHAPFELALGIGEAGVRVAERVHERTGWFPRISKVGVRREETAAGYRLVSTSPEPLSAQCAGASAVGSVAIVDDTIYSGLTVRAVLGALVPAVRRRAHVFCLRAVAESLPAVAAVGPVTAGVTAPGRIDRDVSFINASGLVIPGAIRRSGLPPLTFCDRPEWIAAWFPSDPDGVIALGRQLAARLRMHAGVA